MKANPYYWQGCYINSTSLESNLVTSFVVPICSAQEQKYFWQYMFLPLCSSGSYRLRKDWDILLGFGLQPALSFIVGFSHFPSIAWSPRDPIVILFVFKGFCQICVVCFQQGLKRTASATYKWLWLIGWLCRRERALTHARGGRNTTRVNYPLITPGYVVPAIITVVSNLNASTVSSC